MVLSPQPPVPVGGSAATGHALVDGDGHPASVGVAVQSEVDVDVGVCRVWVGVDCACERVGDGGGGGGELMVYAVDREPLVTMAPAELRMLSSTLCVPTPLSAAGGTIPGLGPVS